MWQRLLHAGGHGVFIVMQVQITCAGAALPNLRRLSDPHLSG